MNVKEDSAQDIPIWTRDKIIDFTTAWGGSQSISDIEQPYSWENNLVNNHVSVIKKNLSGDSENTDEERTHQILLAQLTLTNKSLEALHKKMDQMGKDHLVFQENIASLSEEVADKETIIKSEAEIIKNINKESEAIQVKLESKLEGLKSDLNHYFPHKQAFKAGSISSCFFLSSLFVYALTDIVIVTPFWNFLGLVVSLGVLILSYFLYLDWKKLDE